MVSGSSAPLGDQAYDRIKSDILSCMIPPRARLTESYLTEHYAFGKASIRSALKQLAREGLIEALPRYGHIVAGYEEIDARNLFQVQLLLEVETARRAAGHVNEQRLRELDQQCANHLVPGGLDEAGAWLRANTAFHTEVANATGNPLLARYVTMLFEGLERLLYSSGRVDEAVALVAHTHSDTIDRLLAGDTAGAVSCVREQVAQVHATLLDFFHSLGEHPRRG